MKVLIVLAVVGSFALGNADQPKKTFTLMQGTSGVYGNVTMLQTACTEPVFIEVNIIGLSPGKHGFHIHEKGDLSDGCASTGGHYNPEKATHGGPNDQVRHIGDLGNVVADENGIVKTSFSDSVVSMYGSYSVVGRAFVVHAGVDDFGKTNHPDSLKTGNAGGRLACGVIGTLEPFDEPEQDCSSGQLSKPVKAVVGFLMSIFIVRALGN